LEDFCVTDLVIKKICFLINLCLNFIILSKGWSKNQANSDSEVFFCFYKLTNMFKRENFHTLLLVIIAIATASIAVATFIAASTIIEGKNQIESKINNFENKIEDKIDKSKDELLDEVDEVKSELFEKVDKITNKITGKTNKIEDKIKSQSQKLEDKFKKLF
jgi:predicted PurR-regulated permease PerM